MTRPTLEEQAVKIVNVLERRPGEVIHFLWTVMKDAPDDESRLELMRLVDAEVVRRQPWIAAKEKMP